MSDKMKPHRFKGRLDRWCEICNEPDRHPIHKFQLKRKKATIGQIETEGWELTAIIEHVGHQLLFNPWPTENLVCLICATCGVPLIDFTEEKLEDG